MPGSKKQKHYKYFGKKKEEPTRRTNNTLLQNWKEKNTSDHCQN
jgi:hypothetical protein